MSEPGSRPFRDPVAPVAGAAPRPVWSVMIPTYNCARYLRETLASVLAQDPGPNVMQIEVVDDHSTQDDPASVVQELGRGRVGFYRQPENVGHTRNFLTCLERSRGKLIHLLHGDDCVREGFYKKLGRAFEDRPEIGAAFCRYISMDEHSHWQTISPLEQVESGVLDNWLEKIATGQRLQTPSMVVRREVYERLGGFDHRLLYSEDWEMWVRIAAHYPVWYEVEPLAVYRIHSASRSGGFLRTGDNGRDLRLAIDINKAHLPEGKVTSLSRKARKNFALACLRRAHRALGAEETDVALAQMLEALKTSRSVEALCRAAFFAALWTWKSLYLRASGLSGKQSSSAPRKAAVRGVTGKGQA